MTWIVVGSDKLFREFCFVRQKLVEHVNKDTCEDHRSNQWCVNGMTVPRSQKTNAMHKPLRVEIDRIPSPRSGSICLRPPSWGGWWLGACMEWTIWISERRHGTPILHVCLVYAFRWAWYRVGNMRDVATSLPGMMCLIHHLSYFYQANLTCKRRIKS